MKLRLLVLLCLLCAAPLSAEEPAEKPAASESPSPAAADPAATSLGIRQQRVLRMMADVERRFLSLAQSLEQTEPQRAERLVKAFQQSKQMLLEQRMEETARLLDASKLTLAEEEQQKIIDDLASLIDLLTGQDNDWEKIREEIERLEQWRDQVERLLEREHEHWRESENLTDREKTLAELARRIAEVEKLIREQEQLGKQTGQARAQGIQALEKLADPQRALRGRTQKLADEIAAAGRPVLAPPMPSPEDPSPSDPNRAPQPMDPAAAPAAMPAGEKPAAETPSAADSDEPGARPLAQAAGHQQAAEDDLGQAKGKGAEDQQAQALAALRAALSELNQERMRIASLPDEALEKLAGEQAETADSTARLADEMSQAPAPVALKDQKSGSPGGAGQSAGAQGSPGQPGQPALAKAGGAMQRASDRLQAREPAAATPQQRDALAQLRRALEEIEKRLAQLREEMQADKLAQLESRFRELLARQQKATFATVELEQKQIANDGRLGRAEALAVARLAEEERNLAELGEQAREILVEDGTSVVFPRVVERLVGDLDAVAALLDEKRIDPYTQGLQREIEGTIEELIEALKRAQKQQQMPSEGQGGEGGSPGEQPLLPSSAELKLLRSAQLRINRRTEAIGRLQTDAGLDETMRGEIRSLADLQEQIAAMAAEIAGRN